MLVNNLGFMQGRLTEKGGFYPQEFPAEGWQEEFYLAKETGFDCIEWMFNAKQWEENPIVLSQRLKEITDISQKTNIKVSGICANYFMCKSIYSTEELDFNCMLLNKLLCNAQAIGCKNVIIPLFEESEIQLDNAQIYKIINMLAESDVFILFEVNERLPILKKWLSGFARRNVGICYDIGNAAGLGYDSVKELNDCGDIVKNVHLKDKKCGGATVMLGDGDAHFEKCFDALQQYSYSGCYILESYYQEAVKDTCKNLRYIKEMMK